MLQHQPKLITDRVGHMLHSKFEVLVENFKQNTEHNTAIDRCVQGQKMEC